MKSFLVISNDSNRMSKLIFRIMMNAMAGLPAALGGQLGMGMSHQALSHQLSQLRLGPLNFLIANAKI